MADASIGLIYVKDNQLEVSDIANTVFKAILLAP